MLNDLEAHKLIGGGVSAPVTDEWVRPADWLPLPSVSSSEQKFVGLFPVFNIDAGNFLAFQFESDYTVDWGDGITENFASGDTAEHEYNWDSISSSTLTSRGYRQVIVTVTPQTESDLTSIDIVKLHSNISTEGYGTMPWLDIALSMPMAQNTDVINISTGSIWADSLENLLIKNTGEVTEIDILWATQLRNLTIENATHLTNIYGNATLSIEKVTISGLVNTGSVSPLIGGFQRAKKIELKDLNSYDNADFYSIAGIEEIKLSGLTSLSDGAFADLIGNIYNNSTLNKLSMSDLSSITELTNPAETKYRGSLTLNGLESVTSLDNAFYLQNKLKSVSLTGLSSVTSMQETFLGCSLLESISLIGTENVTNFSQTFNNCSSLTEGPNLDTSSAESMNGMFVASGIVSCPAYDTSNVTDASQMFNSCEKLQSVPLMDFSSCTDMSNMFVYNYSLKTVPLFNTSNVTNFYYMFGECASLVTLPAFDLSSAEIPEGFSDIYIFDGYANCLASAPFENIKVSISFAYCALSRQAILEIFNNLQTVESEQIINLTGNYGAGSLTPTDLAIATDKGWTVTT